MIRPTSSPTPKVRPKLFARSSPVRLGALALASATLVAFLLTPAEAFGQSEPDTLKPILSEEILAPAAAQLQIRSYILNHVAAPPTPTTAEQWTQEAQRLRHHLLQDVVFHGWPHEWVEAAPKFEDLGTIETGQGY